jgi:[acyl-carrier-protein] S-malonyltransferase
MKPAEIRLQNELEQAEFLDLDFPVIRNVDAQLTIEGSRARTALVEQVCSPVRWVETMQCLLDQGIDVVVELGSGKVLSGLMRRFNKEIKCFQVGDPDSLQRTVEALR